MSKKIIMEKRDSITKIEYFGEQFPTHQKEWENYHSFWQEDYVRFLFQEDIGILTIYDGNHDLVLFWGESIYNVNQFYDKCKQGPILDEVFANDNYRFQAAYHTDKGHNNFYLNYIRDIFIESYDTLF